MDNSRILKKVLVGKFHGRRPVGRPRLRWVDNIRRDSSLLLNIRGWSRVAGNRDIRRQTIEEANIQCRLSRHQRRIIKKWLLVQDSQNNYCGYRGKLNFSKVKTFQQVWTAISSKGELQHSKKLHDLCSSIHIFR